jgi:hypothetical protein
MCREQVWKPERGIVSTVAIRHALRIGICALLAAFSTGCGVRPVTGGTPGVLRYRDKLFSDIQVTVHRVENGSTEQIGFGVTAADGTFQLVTNGARGALRLSPGEYRCTLESVGVPLRIPKPYAHVDTTPLKVSWSASDKGLHLEVPVAPAQ